MSHGLPWGASPIDLADEAPNEAGRAWAADWAGPRRRW